MDEELARARPNQDVDLRRIYISRLVRAKLHKRDLEDEDVRNACDDVIDMAWDWDEVRGWRLYVEGWTRTRMRLFVVLYPTDDPMLWNLGTAYPG